MSKQQTAVEWLIEQIENGEISIFYSDKIHSIKCIPEIVEQAKQMEKESIDDAWRKYRATTNNEDAWSFKEWLKKYYYE